MISEEQEQILIGIVHQLKYFVMVSQNTQMSESEKKTFTDELNTIIKSLEKIISI